MSEKVQNNEKKKQQSVTPFKAGNNNDCSKESRYPIVVNMKKDGDRISAKQSKEVPFLSFPFILLIVFDIKMKIFKKFINFLN